jgi:PAS domain S-box-containing protein
MQAVPFGVIFVRDRVIEWCNDRICQVFGYAREEIIGNLTRMFYETDEEFDRVGRDLYGGLTGYKTNWIETQWKTKSGDK